MMRARAGLCLLLLTSAACRTPPTPPPPQPATPVAAPARLMVDVSGLFLGASSQTVGDRRAVVPGLLARVALERDAMVGGDGVEPWLARVLFRWLITQGAVVQRSQQDASARLIGVRFHTQREEPLVSMGDDASDAWSVRYWAGKDDLSNCGPGVRLPLTSIRLEAVVLDAASREVASISEVVLAAPAQPRQRIDTDGDPCAAIVAAMEEELAPGDRELVAAAELALERGFQQIISASR